MFVFVFGEERLNLCFEKRDVIARSMIWGC